MGGQVKLNINKILIKRRKPKRRHNHLKKKQFPICLILQELYASCKSVFKGPGFVPSPSDVQSLCGILDRMEPEDLGLSKSLPFFNASSSSSSESVRVTCTTVYECSNFSLVLFFLPARAVIPLHNHPDMTVFNKLLFGRIHVKSYDLVDDPHSFRSESLRLGRVQSDGVQSAPCAAKVLYPRTGGNIHQLTAVAPSVVLDVIGPPYSKEDGRDCTYYREVPFRGFGNEGTGEEDRTAGEEYGWLEEIEVPEGSDMDGIRYMGPRIIDSFW